MAISDSLQAVKNRIAAACVATGRAPDAVQLLVVSKTFPASAVREAFAAGAHAFGENYVQEGLSKVDELAELRSQIEWHLIGPLQSNKTKSVAEHFDWVHSVDRLKIAQRLSEQRPPQLPPLNVCLQVNISGESSKSGLAPADVAELAGQVDALPRLKLRGLMAVPAPGPDALSQHRAMAALFETLKNAGLAPDTLSLGMSADMEDAIAAGSTMVRVGSAIFGARG
ncbi:MAG: YggS family pyridoxal phosphate-dependent enzyme [Roseateles sp.]|uniref:YggS family pyridoxal phosphate-dependent enzyme n=1 Tax=Roseateles sp. TaxID=1971397 RepID=UPI0040352078